MKSIEGNVMKILIEKLVFLLLLIISIVDNIKPIVY